MSNIRTWLGRIITLLAFLFVAKFLFEHWESIEVSFTNKSWLSLIGAFVTSILFFVIRSYGWHLLVKKNASKSIFWSSSWYLASSEIIRYIPGNAWGLSARVIKSEKFSLKKSQGASLLLQESILIVSSAGIISSVGLIFLPLIPYYFKIIGVAIGIFSLGLLLSPFFLHFLFNKIAFLRALNQDPTQQLINRLIRLFPLYLLLWISFALSHYLLFICFFSSGPFFELLFFSVISWLAGYASLVTPSGLGVREVTLGFGLEQSVGLGIANAFAIISRIWYIAIEVLWYFTSLTRYKKITPRINE